MNVPTAQLAAVAKVALSVAAQAVAKAQVVQVPKALKAVVKYSSVVASRARFRVRTHRLLTTRM